MVILGMPSKSPIEKKKKQDILCFLMLLSRNLKLENVRKSDKIAEKVQKVWGSIKLKQAGIVNNLTGKKMVVMDVY